VTVADPDLSFGRPTLAPSLHFPLPSPSLPPNVARESVGALTVSSPSGVQGRALAANAFLVYFEAQKRAWQ